MYFNVLKAFEKNPTVDCVYIQSGTMATVGLIEAVEDKIGKPVVSSNS